ncbi:MAG: bifunctional phosphopantothenoylcysteine decarboxylase/phosphopantothenate--cysteine ligase CoaBC, partial [Thaumarchaeota archaeon]|nr:bifunctional phosphopantothenoylcysteine decarboxylase/phosphopantothenate--cysteine ligase CoaBC [Nitrososphaerota archaeon]
MQGGLHPSKGIKGSEGRELEGKRIVLALTGSVAAYKAPDLARGLMRHGAEVVAVMSERARDFVGPELMKWATGNEVVTELTGELEHLRLSEFDMLIVAPCTANTVCKL